jgi:hypothetical protein
MLTYRSATCECDDAFFIAVVRANARSALHFLTV